MFQFDKRNLAMMTDLYELTMANGYFVNRCDKRAAFDLFYRRNPDAAGFAIFAGLEQVIDYLENLHFSAADIDYLNNLGIFSSDFLDALRTFHFKGELYAMPEGTVMYPNEPILTIVGNLIEAQLVETAILAQINHQSLIATKARRIVRAAKGRLVSDFGARRAHNMDAATYGARAAFIGGVHSTATVSAGQMFNIPLSGTMAHSWVMMFSDEFDAFRRYAEVYPDNTALLLDTYDVINSGVPNAIRVAKEILAPQGKRLKGVRIDSGDLAYLSKKIRRLLDDAALQDCKIIVSNSLDEFTIASLLQQGAAIDSFGVGERLITAKSEPVFGAVYKLVAVEEGDHFTPRIKVSENVAKITNPALKNLYRIYDTAGHAVADLIALAEETVDMSKPYRYVDPVKPWKVRRFENCSAKNLTRHLMTGGKRIGQLPSLHEIRDYVSYQLANEIWQEEQRFENPHRHYLDMTPAYYDMKMSLLDKTRRADNG